MMRSWDKEVRNGGQLRVWSFSSYRETSFQKGRGEYHGQMLPARQMMN